MPVSNHHGVQESCATLFLASARRDDRFHALYNFNITTSRLPALLAVQRGIHPGVSPHAFDDRYRAPGLTLPGMASPTRGTTTLIVFAMESVLSILLISAI